MNNNSFNLLVGAQSYSINYVNGGQRTASTSNNEFVLRNLLPGTAYNITITTVAQEEGLNSSTSDVIYEITSMSLNDFYHIQFFPNVILIESDICSY